jgi:hypothetical protein
MTKRERSEFPRDGHGVLWSDRALASEAALAELRARIESLASALSDGDINDLAGVVRALTDVVEEDEGWRPPMLADDIGVEGRRNDKTWRGDQW